MTSYELFRTKYTRQQREYPEFDMFCDHLITYFPEFLNWSFRDPPSDGHCLLSSLGYGLDIDKASCFCVFYYGMTKVLQLENTCFIDLDGTKMETFEKGLLHRKPHVISL